MEKKADPSPGLVTKAGALSLIACRRKQERRALARRRRDHDPALVRAKRRILNNCEAEDVAEESEALVVARDKNSDGGEALEHSRA